MSTGSLAEFPVGSILRIRLKDFLTYDWLDFECGPALNFVLGPNGSGKSSLVSAICLGLAGKPEILQRSPKLSGFVRTGKHKATIEIELKGRGLEERIAVRRIITTENEKSDWKVNGAKSSQAAVKDIIDGLNIQIENLCNFLPQERVHSFANLKPDELMLETIRTIRGRETVQVFEDLKNYKVKEFDLESTLDAQQKTLSHLERQNAAIEHEVSRYLEREQITDKIKIMTRKRPWILYNVARDDFMVAKEEKRARTEEFNQANQVNKPLQEQINGLSREIETFKRQSLTAKEIYSESTTSLKKIDQDIQAAETGTDEARLAITNHQKSVAARAQRIRSFELEAVELSKEANRSPPDVSSALKESLNQASLNLRAFNLKKSTMQEAFDRAQTASSSLQREKFAAERKLTELENVRNGRIEQLRQFSKQTYDAYVWLNENRHLFKYEVAGPICLDVSVKDTQYASSIESCINRYVNNSFVTLCGEDQEMLLSVCNDQLRLGINSIQNDGSASLSSYQPRKSREELNSLGFECWAIDQVDGPENVLIALCEHAHLHEFPIAMKPVDNDKAQRAGLFQYSAAGQRVTWKVSKYGDRLASMRSTKIYPAKFLTTGDEELRGQLVDSLRKLETRLFEAESETKAARDRMSRLEEEELSLQNERAALLQEKTRIVDSQRAHEKILRRLAKILESVETEKAESLTTAKVESSLIRECRVACEKQITLALKYKKALAKLLECGNDRVLLQLKLTTAEERKLSLENSVRFQSDSVRAAKQALERAEQRASEAKARAKERLDSANRLGQLDDEMRALFATFPDALDELDEALAREKARADLVVDTDPNLIGLFENRKKQIIELSKKLESSTKALGRMRRDIASKKESFEADLDGIVSEISSQFSGYFAALGNAGQVVLNKLAVAPVNVRSDSATAAVAREDNYANWGLEIMVKFRDTDQLAPLTGNRQSGGERSVSTMVFLMALQVLSTSPVRVVDEINQGMDPRNERAVHAQIVKTVCGSVGKSQYFLITPKLLPDLVYHEAMKIHVVYNGEGMPDGDAWKSCAAIKWTEQVGQ